MSNPMKTFNPTAEHPARAVQAWQILVGKAMNRQTVTYKGLSKLMYGKEAAGVLAAILGHIAFYCEDNNIPPLTALVVGIGDRKAYFALPVVSLYVQGTCSAMFCIPSCGS